MNNTDTLQPEAGSRTNLAPAVAKARLITVMLTKASQARVSPLAHAALAHHVAESWPCDDGWTSELSDARLAARLSVHPTTLRRALRELVQAGLLDRRKGDGRFPSRHVVGGSVDATPGCAPTLPQGVRPRGPRGSVDATPGVASAFTSSIELSKTDQQQQQGITAAAAAGGCSTSLTEEDLRRNMEYLMARPQWLSFDRPWIDNIAARELASIEITFTDVDTAIANAKRSRSTLKNPAGYVVRALRLIGKANADRVDKATCVGRSPNTLRVDKASGE